MNSSHSDGPSSFENPFQTPAVESIDSDTSDSPVTPSVMLVAICIGVAWGIKAISYLGWWEDGDLSDFYSLMWPAYDVLSGPVVGLGLALLLTALLRSQFRRLAPGHWLLISFSMLLIADVGYALDMFISTMASEAPVDWLYWMEESSPYLLSALVFGSFLLIRESRAWLTFAWLCLLYYVVSLVDSSIEVALLSNSVDYSSPGEWILGVRLLRALLWLASAIAFLVAVTIDLAFGVRRDALHYVGLIVPTVMIPCRDLLASSWFPL